MSITNRHWIVLVTVTLAALPFAACGDDDSGTPAVDAGASGHGGSGGSHAGAGGSGGAHAGAGGNSAGAGGHAGGGGSGQAVKLSDSDIAQVLITANTGEIDQANAVSSKLLNNDARGFAAMMVAAHTAARTREQALFTALNITPSTNSVSTMLMADSTKIVDQLKSVPATSSDLVYMESQVKVHQEVLDIIDNDLIPNVMNSQLKSELDTFKGEVTDHLNRARTLVMNLGGDAGVVDAGI